MKRRLLVAGTLVLLVLLGALAYVAIPVALDLRAARDAARPGADALDVGRLARARDRLARAERRLDSPVAGILGALPLVGANLQAVDAAVGGSGEVVGDALTVARSFQSLDERGLMDDGRVRVSALGALHEPVGELARSLAALHATLDEHDGGALLPAVWESLHEMSLQVGDLRRSVQKAQRLLAVAPSLLGSEGPRDYLILLINNAELRGSGGIASGVGLLRMSDGRIELGPLTSIHELNAPPFRKVPAPPDYERRFSTYKANTTLWLNVTWSPDVPDSALVASRLFELQTGVSTDGALVLDPRGLEALTPRQEVLRVPSSGRPLRASRLAEFAYSGAYEAFTDQAARRDALLELGREALREVLERDFSEARDLRTVADAFAGQHIRLVSFAPIEQQALADAGASGAITSEGQDSLLVTGQNFGDGDGRGTKLDYWARREVEHACSIGEGRAACTSRVAVRNAAPPSLPRYVAGRPYGVLRELIEIYVPREARVESVSRDGGSVKFFDEPQDGRRSIGVFVQLPRGRATTIEVDYELDPTEDGYSFAALPQPLARDARLRIALEAPPGWEFSGPGGLSEGGYQLNGPFDEPLRVMAKPIDRPGLTGLWERVVRFWREPPF